MLAYQSTGPGALNIDLSCQDGQFVIENISFYDDAKVGTELNVENDWKRRGLYIGPTFDTLDVGLQDEFEKYLQERGINEAVASFIPEYCGYKEQQVGIITFECSIPYSPSLGIREMVRQGQDIC